MDLDEMPSPFMNLPNEMWEPILKKLTQNEALNLRLVNTDFKMKVDGLYDEWVIRLDEKFPYLDEILDLRVKRVSVNSLLNPLSNRPPGIIFKYPTLLKEIYALNRLISAENLHALLQYKNLKKMTIVLNGWSKDTFWKTLDPPIGYDFPHLHTLEVQLSNMGGHVFEGNVFDRLTTRSKLPSLKSLTVRIWNTNLIQSEECTLLFALFSFLGRTGQTLKHLRCTDQMPWNYRLSPSYDLVLRNCSTLETLNIESSWGLGQHGVWSSLVQNQSKLVVIHFEMKIDHLSSICANIFARNFKTLTRITFEVIPTNEEETGQFDISIFGQCVNLRELTFYWCSTDRIDSTSFFEIHNLSTLPKRIETIEFEDVFIHSEDLSNFLNTHACLTSLTVDRLFRWNIDYNGRGLNASLSNDIKSHGSLKYTSVNGQLIIY